MKLRSSLIIEEFSYKNLQEPTTVMGAYRLVVLRLREEACMGWSEIAKIVGQPESWCRHVHLKVQEWNSLDERVLPSSSVRESIREALGEIQGKNLRIGQIKKSVEASLNGRKTSYKTLHKCLIEQSTTSLLGHETQPVMAKKAVGRPPNNVVRFSQGRSMLESHSGDDSSSDAGNSSNRDDESENVATSAKHTTTTTPTTASSGIAPRGQRDKNRKTRRNLESDNSFDGEIVQNYKKRRQTRSFRKLGGTQVEPLQQLPAPQRHSIDFEQYAAIDNVNYLEKGEEHEVSSNFCATPAFSCQVDDHDDSLHSDHVVIIQPGRKSWKEPPHSSLLGTEFHANMGRIENVSWSSPSERLLPQSVVALDYHLHQTPIDSMSENTHKNTHDQSAPSNDDLVDYFHGQTTTNHNDTPPTHLTTPLESELSSIVPPNVVAVVTSTVPTTVTPSLLGLPATTSPDAPTRQLAPHISSPHTHHSHQAAASPHDQSDAIPLCLPDIDLPHSKISRNSHTFHEATPLIKTEPTSTATPASTTATTTTTPSMLSSPPPQQRPVSELFFPSFSQQ